MLSLPWEVVTRLKLHPIGPVSPRVLGLTFEDEGFGENDTATVAYYSVCEPRKLHQLREALGQWVDSPTGLRRPDKTPFYTLLCEVQRVLTEVG